MTEKTPDRGEWRFINSGAGDGFRNMAIDEAILKAHLSGSVPPTLRVYTWHPHALSLGYFQSLDREVDQQRCSELGIDVVRRLTGGRAVFHGDELTYSIIISERYGFPPSISGAYAILCRGLIAAYRILGVEVSLVQSEKGISSPACFTSSTMADLVFRGRKVAGSAQFRKGSVLLQHGSLPLSLDTRLMLSLLKFPSEAAREKSLAAMNKKTAALNNISPRKIDCHTLKEALFAGFQEAFNIKFRENMLTPEETETSQRLALEKYGTFAWNQNGREKESRQDVIPAAA